MIGGMGMKNKNVLFAVLGIIVLVVLVIDVPLILNHNATSHLIPYILLQLT